METEPNEHSGTTQVSSTFPFIDTRAVLSTLTVTLGLWRWSELARVLARKFRNSGDKNWHKLNLPDLSTFHGLEQDTATLTIFTHSNASSCP